MRPGQPITKQRSPWLTMDGPALPEAVLCRWYHRNVHDGTLFCCVAREPLGPNGEIEWHLSISARDHKGKPHRYPTWDEIAHARYELLPAERTFVMYLPPPGEYVAVHDTTFHLHEDPRSKR